jgi:hypothetical protein
VSSENTTIKVEHLQRGQPGPYQPHVYAARITIEGSRSWNGLTEWQVRQLVKAVVHGFTEDEPDGSMASHFAPRLKRLEKVEEERDGLGPTRAVWFARVEEPYTD